MSPLPDAINNEVTRVLDRMGQGDPQAAGQLLPLVYGELRQLAGQLMAREKQGHTLQPTALVHEAFLRLLGPEPGLSWEGRRHFFAAAAEAMRRILVESARRKHRRKRGGDLVRQELEEGDLALPEKPEQLLALDEALERLETANPQAAELVKLRYFSGCTNAEAAALLAISPRKANQVWAYARAWLLDALGDEAG
jgi:RNA polymerase sigma factor (TIGR02999 family)